MEIRAYVTAQFDLRYSHSGCVKLLARLGFEYRKPKTLPRVADVAKQAEFIAMYENMLNSLADDEAVYFAPSRRFQANTCQAMDAVHPEYQSKPAFGWVKKGANPTLKTTAGRARVNIHGALNLETLIRLSSCRSQWVASVPCNCWPRLRTAIKINASSR